MRDPQIGKPEGGCFGTCRRGNPLATHIKEKRRLKIRKKREVKMDIKEI